MKRRLVRALAIVGVGAAALAVGALGLGWMAEQRALEELAAQGVTWERLERDGLLVRQLHGVAWGPVRAGAVWANLRRPDRIWVYGAEVDLQALVADRSASGASVDGAAGGPVDLAGGLPDRLSALEVQIEDLQIRWGERVLLQELSGHLRGGAIALDGDGAALLAPAPSGAMARVQISRPWTHEHASATLDVAVEIQEGGWPLSAAIEDLRIEHPLLSADRALALAPILLEGSVDPEARAIAATARLGELEIDVTADCAAGCEVALELPDSDAADALDPLTPLSPELARATIGGTIGGSLRWSEGGDWSIDPRIQDLIVAGAADLDRLRGGRFTYLVADAEGERRTRPCGEGAPGWTPLDQVSDTLIQAILAAEDSAFWTHGGYDMSAIQEAIADNREAGGVARGGSTLTQQLAKNLFFDGERTLSRKLRELLVAVEMERVLGKERILELYVNVVEWGPEIYGIHEATDRYFLKRPARLDPNEAAFLAAILPAPKSQYERWYLGGRGSPARMRAILENMADAGWLHRADAGRWAAAELRFVPPP